MAFQITLLPDGDTFSAKAYETVLDSAVQAGHQIPYGCRNGTCGSCKARIVSGEVDYGEYAGSALTDTEKENGKALLCCALPLSDLTLEAREQPSHLPQPRILPARVERKDRLADDVIALFIKPPSNQNLEFKAGQYIEFLLKDGKRRAFSLSNAPHIDHTLELHIRLVEGGLFTEQVFNEMPEKTILRIEAPLGTFYLREETQKPIIMVAGGTGFAPIKGLVEYMIHENIQRDVTLYWGARTLKDLYMADLPKAWAKDHPNIKFIPVLSGALATDNWDGKTGYVHQAVLDDFESGNFSSHQIDQFEVYCCGAPVMVESAFKTFTAKGLPENAFFADIFSYAAPNT
jgi:CDP-4-dehydro-6-deoxyglucose reductase